MSTSPTIPTRSEMHLRLELTAALLPLPKSLVNDSETVSPEIEHLLSFDAASK